MLRAGYDANPELRMLRVSTPAARLGIVCHALLEAAGRGELFSGIESSWREKFVHLWDEQVHKQARQAESAPLERHFGPPERWPGYELKRAYLEMQLERLAEAHAQNVQREKRAEIKALSAEQEYTAFDGRLVGRIDHLAFEDGGVVVEDYKSGVIVETNDSDIPELKASYRRQLLLYAALYSSSTGTWPARARIIPLRGKPVTVDVDPSEALKEVNDALGHLNTYQSLFSSGPDITAMANPTEAICAFCPYKSLCPQFWATISPEWELGSRAIEGSIRARAAVSNSISLSIQSTRGNVTPEMYVLHGLTPQQFPDAAVLTVGTQVRAVNCRQIGDDTSRDLSGTLYTQLWEVMAATQFDTVRVKHEAHTTLLKTEFLPLGPQRPSEAP